MNRLQKIINRLYCRQQNQISKMPLWVYPCVCMISGVMGCLFLWRIFGFSDKTNLDYVGFYLPVAKNILSGKGIVLNGAPALDYPPGYPLIIAGMLKAASLAGMSELLANQLLAVICFSGCSLLIFTFARIFWKLKSATVVACVWSFLPITLYINKQTSSEHPFMVVLYGCLLLFFLGLRIRRHRWLLFAAIGALCGIAMLIRPIAIGLGAVLILLLVAYRLLGFRTRIVLCLCIFAGNILTILPWEAWAFHKTGQVIMLCKGRGSFSMFDGLTFAIPDLPFRSKNEGVAVPNDVRRFMEELLKKYPLPPTSKEIYAFVADYSLRKPVTMGKLFLIKAGRSWYGTTTNRNERSGLVLQVLLITTLVIALLRLSRHYQGMQYLQLCCIVFMCYFWALSIMVLSTLRYMMPVESFLLVLLPALWRAKTNNLLSASIASPRNG